MLSCIGDKCYDLIDGQQRFTVTTLIGIVLKKYAEVWGAFLKDGERLNFTARSHDKEYLRCRIRGEKPQTINKKMEEAIRCITKFMECPDNFSSDEERKNLPKMSTKDYLFSSQNCLFTMQAIRPL